METEILEDAPQLVIRRLVLAPGEKSDWHHDNCRRFTVIVSGDRLCIEYADNAEQESFEVRPGMTGWDDPQQRVHRAVNVGQQVYHEVVSFYRDDQNTDPQPIHEV